MSKTAIKVDYVLVCDDVRTEDNGKVLIIGLYTDNIVLPKGSDTYVYPITFFIHADVPRDKAVPVVTWLEGPAGQRMQESDFGILQRPEGPFGPAQLVWRILPWRAEGLGKYKLHMTQWGDDSVIHEFEVMSAA